MQVTNPSWLVLKAPRDLKSQIRIAVEKGYHVVSQTETTAQLLREKKFSCLIATIGLLCFFFGLVVYVLYYLSKRQDKIYLDIETQPAKEEAVRLIEEEKKKPWWKKNLGWVVFIIVAVSFGGMISAFTTTDENPPVAQGTEITPQVVKLIFDIPSLLGKNIDELKKTLGAPKDGSEPTALQLQMGVGEWDNSWEKDGETLLITYDPKSRKVIDFFILGVGSINSTTDKEHLLTVGGLKTGQQSYKVDFVKAIKDPSQFTGVKVTPTL